MRLVCVCGRIINLPSAEPGAKVRCPKCRARLHIPTEKQDKELIRWFCSCGQRLKAHVRSSGREINCPDCGRPCTVPFVNRDDDFIDAKFLGDDSEMTTHGSQAPPPMKPVEEPSLRQERKRRYEIDEAEVVDGEIIDAEIIEAEIVDAEALEDVEPASSPESKAESDIAEDQLELIPLPHEKAAPPPASTQDEPIPLAGLEMASTTSDAENGFELAAPAPQPQPEPSQSGAPHILMAEPVRGASSEWDDEDEGIRARDLKRYFNVRGGVEAAKSGFTQVLNGHWLYIPYALLGGCMSNLAIILIMRAQGQTGLQILMAIVPLIFSLYLYAAFVGCVKDGVFERLMGIERLLHHGVKHLLRFSGTFLLMIPIGAGLGFIGVIGATAATTMAPGITKIGVIGMTVMGVVFFFTWMTVPPIVSVLEEANPFAAVGRGLLFGVKNVWAILIITVFAIFMTFLASTLWWYGRILTLMVLGRWMWLFQTVDSFASACIGAVFMGLLTACIMVLYLSDLSEERLQAIHSRLRGPEPVMWRMHLAIGIGAIALIGLSFLMQRSADDWSWIRQTRSLFRETDTTESYDFSERSPDDGPV